MDFTWTLKQRSSYNKQPPNFHERFYSQGPLYTPSCVDTWVTVKFATGSWNESVILLGDDLGNVGIYDVDRVVKNRGEKIMHKFTAHRGAIMDFVCVPNDSCKVVTTSGDSTIRFWNLDAAGEGAKLDSICRGHDGSVRSISFSSQPNIFVTGGRDGSIRLWDSRTISCRKTGGKSSKFAYKAAHAPRQGKSPHGRTPRKQKEAPSVTSVVFLNDFLVASASSDGNSGIKIWDIRKPPHNDHAYAVNVYQIPTFDTKTTGFGVTSLALDRTGSRLFASCTNSVIYEYDVISAVTQHVNTYTGATIRDYYTQISCSPTADMIVCGSEDQKAYLWDLQPQYRYKNEIVGEENSDAELKRSRLPKWTLGGHGSKVLSASWSQNSSYMLTLDNETVRVWSQDEDEKRMHWSCCEDDKNLDVKEQPDTRLERIESYKLPLNDDAITKIDGMRISPRRRTSSFYRSPQKKSTKRPLLTSPFKPLTPLTEMSPKKKLFKPSNSPGSPLKEITELSNSPMLVKKRKTVGAFYKRHPTENLPNVVYDRFLKNLLGTDKEEDQEKSELSKTAKKRIDDWWTKSARSSDLENIIGRSRLPSVSEFGESICQNVVDKSPKKLMVKLTPVKESKESKVLKRDGSKRKPSRNLLDYFNRTPR